MCHNDGKRHSGPSIGEEWNYERIYGEITIKIDCREKIRLHFVKQT
jgi:hypothetical protein